VGQPLIAAAPAVGAVPVVVEVEAESVALALGDAEVALELDEAAGGALLLWAEELVVELEPPQAATAMATTTASGARPNSRRGVLTARTLDQPRG
jgi:hypothetical protein